MVSYNRPTTAAQTLSAFVEQTVPPDTITVVDNSPQLDLASRLDSIVGTTPVKYLATKQNIGPAGGIAVGMSSVLEHAQDEDWILSIDDDDPPPGRDTLERLRRLATYALSVDSNVAAVGNVGQNFDFRRGRVERVADSELQKELCPVDHIGGNQCPLYRVLAVRSEGVFDERLFFGFEELEYGLRLRSRGWNIYCDGQWRNAQRKQRSSGKLAVHSPNRLSLSDAPSKPSGGWRYYYSKRNLVYILVRHDRRLSAARVLLEGIAHSLAIAVTTSLRGGLIRTGLTIRAGHDAIRGHMGLTIEPNSRNE